MPLTAPQSLPTASGDAATLARQLLRLVGPGWQAPDGSSNAADALARGATLADSRQMLLDTALEAFPSLASDLLSEWEALLGVPADDTLPDADRPRASRGLRPRARARRVAARPSPPRSRPSPRRAPSETTAARCAAALASPRDVFRFAVVVPVGFVQSVPKRARVAAIVDRMKPAHTMAQFTNLRTDGFFCNDPLSLTNNTVL